MTTTKNLQKLTSRANTSIYNSCNNTADNENAKVMESLKMKAELYDKLSNNDRESMLKDKDEYMVDFLASNSKLDVYRDNTHNQSQPLSHTHSSFTTATTIPSSSHNLSTTEETSSLTSASRVKSQWERGTHAKEYLDDIHIQTTIQRHKAHTTTHPLHTIDDTSTTNTTTGLLSIHGSSSSTSTSSSVPPTVKSAKDARRELLLSKKQKLTHTHNGNNNDDNDHSHST